MEYKDRSPVMISEEHSMILRILHELSELSFIEVSIPPGRAVHLESVIDIVKMNFEKFIRDRFSNDGNFLAILEGLPLR
jgi:hypothetical protein